MQDNATLLRKKSTVAGGGGLRFCLVQFSSVQFRIKLYGGPQSSRFWEVGGRMGVEGVNGGWSRR